MIQKKYLGGKANPLPHHKNTTTNLKVHLKKGEMEGSTKIQSQGSTTSQVLLNRLQIPATALLILGLMFFSNLCTDVDLIEDFILNTPYSRKFSRGPIFVEGQFSLISQSNFRGWPFHNRSAHNTRLTPPLTTCATSAFVRYFCSERSS